ncbi:hypothetical protein TNCV_3999651 [Trichonephila clavipes]|nr:hypothetical protein TNCV_3999651 [Trichonephila clavipes]
MAAVAEYLRSQTQGLRCAEQENLSRLKVGSLTWCRSGMCRNPTHSSLTVIQNYEYRHNSPSEGDVKVVTLKCLGDPPVDRVRLNIHPVRKSYDMDAGDFLHHKDSLTWTGVETCKRRRTRPAPNQLRHPVGVNFVNQKKQIDPEINEETKILTEIWSCGIVFIEQSRGTAESKVGTKEEKRRLI